MTGSISAAAATAAIARLRAAGCVFAEDEAAILCAAAPGEAALDELVRRRSAGEPLEQVVGYADFCGVRVRLRPGVFVPRVRSELLVRCGIEAVRLPAQATPVTEAAASTKDHAIALPDAPAQTENAAAPRDASAPTRDHAAPMPDAPAQTENAAARTKKVVVDLCCGSGALGLAVQAKVPGIDLYAADVQAAAVACARDNFGARRGRVFAGDLFAALPSRLKGRTDVLLANVPYVATRHIALLPAEARDHEPACALDGGADGLDVFRAVAAAAPEWLAPGATMLSEITEAQIDAASAALLSAGLHPEIRLDDDLEATVIAGHFLR